MPVDLQCPVCGDGQGLARRVSTVPGREDIVVVYMTCDSCSHEWRTEHISADETTVQPEQLNARHLVRVLRQDLVAFEFRDHRPGLLDAVSRYCPVNHPLATPSVSEGDADFTSRSPLGFCLNRRSVQPDQTWEDATCQPSVASAPRVPMGSA